ncbi:MAG: class I SAM-dependent methyltransferase [Theionarchaea archaeon]|nr:class I SAM-dependent methyltransferase [Theionarchaea archaeon]
MKRNPLECGVFEDEETARKYSRESEKWMENIAKSFISVAKKWGITNGRVLDVGTGPGSLAIEFAKKIPNTKVVGLDLSDVVLAVASENARRNEVASRVSFKKGNAEDMPFDDDTFDLVISSNTLHLLEDPVQMFNEVQRVLTCEGRFFISDFRRSLLGIFTVHIRASYSSKEVRDLLNKSELQNWEVKDSFFWLTILSKEKE